MLEFMRQMNEMKLGEDDRELDARISSYELAYRMQQHAPEAIDLSKETEATKRLYGLDNVQTDNSARAVCWRDDWSSGRAFPCSSPAVAR